MSELKFSPKYLKQQVNKLRMWSLNLAAIYLVVSLILDYLRFSAELLPEVIYTRMTLMVAPLVVLILIFYYHRIKEAKKSFVEKAAFLVVTIIGIGHAEILLIAENGGVVFPKIGVAIVLMYAGLLLAMPIVLATASSLIIIAFTCYIYSHLGMQFATILSYAAFYLMFSSCCVLTNWVCMGILRTNLHLIKEQVSHASTDDLTGLTNRRYFYKHAEKVYKQSVRQYKALAVIVIDLDNFKTVNDRLGHKSGDKVLVEIGRILKQSCRRPFDMAARIGGDEFVLVIYDSQQSHIKEICENTIAEVNVLSQNIRKKDQQAQLGVSIGVAMNEAGESYPIKLLLEMADKSLYDIKSQGKNHYKISDKELFTHAGISINFLKTI